MVRRWGRFRTLGLIPSYKVVAVLFDVPVRANDSIGFAIPIRDREEELPTTKCLALGVALDAGYVHQKSKIEFYAANLPVTNYRDDSAIARMDSMTNSG